MDATAIETRTAKIWLDENDIIRIVSLGMSQESLVDAQENFDAVRELSRGRARPILADIRKTRFMNAEGRKFYTRLEAQELASAVALLIESPLSRVIGSLFLGFSRPPVPIMLFTCADQALAWLRNQDSTHQDP